MQLPPQALTYPPLQPWAVVAILATSFIVILVITFLILYAIQHKRERNRMSERLDTVVHVRRKDLWTIYEDNGVSITRK